MDIWTLKEVLIDRHYEVKRLVKAGDTIVDIGSSIGDFSIYASKKAEKIYAHECDNQRVFLMHENLKLNKVNNVEINQQKVKSLNEIMKNIKRCDFLKIDCEGCEYQIFEKADQENLSKIKHIAMEAHKFNNEMEEKFKNLINQLKQNNFDVNVIENPVHTTICFVFATQSN